MFFVLKHRLTIFVLLLAYGLPALCGQSVHLFHACSAHECGLKHAEQSQACGHCCHHSGAPTESKPRGLRLELPGHDSANCLTCQHHRMLVTRTPVVRVDDAAVLLTTISVSPVLQPESGWSLLLRARGPPSC